MDGSISEIFQLIANFGFPAVMCLLMYKQMNKSSELHKEEVDNLSASINNNTVALEKISAVLEEK